LQVDHEHVFGLALVERVSDEVEPIGMSVSAYFGRYGVVSCSWFVPAARIEVALTGSSRVAKKIQAGGTASARRRAFAVGTRLAA
jgi:hypothetical protein